MLTPPGDKGTGTFPRSSGSIARSLAWRADGAVQWAVRRNSTEKGKLWVVSTLAAVMSRLLIRVEQANQGQDAGQKRNELDRLPAKRLMSSQHLDSRLNCFGRVVN